MIVTKKIKSQRKLFGFILTNVTPIIPMMFLTSCSLSSTRNKVLRDMALGATAGALIAASKEEHRAAYTTMYAGVGAAAAGAVSIYVNASDDENLKQQNENLKTKLDQFQKRLEPQLVQNGNSLFSAPLPKEVSSLVEPGEWKRYKMDQWVQDPNQPNTWYRQVEMFEMIPPTAK